MRADVFSSYSSRPSQCNPSKQTVPRFLPSQIPSRLGCFIRSAFVLYLLLLSEKV